MKIQKLTSLAQDFKAWRYEIYADQEPGKSMNKLRQKSCFNDMSRGGIDS